MKYRAIRFVVLFVCAALISAVWTKAMMSKATAENKPAAAKIQAGTIGGPFTLTDHTGKAVTDADYKGIQLVFFGFTNCPGICPTTLQTISNVLDELGEEEAAKITPLFFTVDPARDTPEVMGEYVAAFHPSIVGLTGTQEQIDETLSLYRVYANKIEMEGMDGYMMDHSSFVYLMGDDGSVLEIFRHDDDYKDMTAQIKKHL